MPVDQIKHLEFTQFRTPGVYEAFEHSEFTKF